jgi:hypothetical protein
MIKPLPVETLVQPELSPVAMAAVRTLLYFDIFHHPLKGEEIHQYLHNTRSERQQTIDSLNSLLQEGIITKNGDYFLVGSDLTIVERRKKGEEESAKAMKTAQKYSKIIAAFPFVRAVFISGSLSKGYMDKDSDIDYFIITEPGRLWLARTLLALFKKTFLMNSRKNFCINYFVAKDNLEIPDRNIFTATELVSVLPAFSYNEYKNFLENNTWSNHFLPNSSRKSVEHCIKPQSGLLKILFEKLFGGRIGELFDTFCFKLTLKFWERKFSHFDRNDFDHRLRSKKNVSKHHPLGYQFKVLKAHEERIKLFELKYGISLS